MAVKRGPNGTFLKGSVANPKGRQVILLPEVQKAIDANRNAFKVIILKELETEVVDWVKNIIAEGKEHGDIIRFKMLVEMALGKMVIDAPEFPVDDEEKALVLEWRRRKNGVNE